MYTTGFRHSIYNGISCCNSVLEAAKSNIHNSTHCVWTYTLSHLVPRLTIFRRCHHLLSKAYSVPVGI